MSAENMSIKGRFRCDKDKYCEIVEYFISKLNEMDLEFDVIDEEYMEEEIFEEMPDYLELNIYECYGIADSAIQFIENDFIKVFPDVSVELYYELLYSDFKEGTKIIYDGVKTEKSEYYVNIQEFFKDAEDECEAIEKFMNEFEKEIGFKLIK